MKKNWKNVLLYIVRIIELLITALPEERLEAAYENGFVDYRALLCQQGGQCLCERRTLTLPSFIGLEVLWLPLCDSYRRNDRSRTPGRVGWSTLQAPQQPQYRYMLHRRTG